MSKYDFLLPQDHAPVDVFRFGVVTQTMPMRVRLDGDIAQTEVTPIILNDPPVVGERVLLLIHNRQLMIIGKVRQDKIELTAVVDLNDLLMSNTYYIFGSANTSYAKHYPILLAGNLEVIAFTSGYVQQIYTTWSGPEGNHRRFIRQHYSGTWRPWREEELWSDWTSLTLQNGWTAYGSGFAPPSYRTSGAKTELKGVFRAGTSNATMATLPADGRPIHGQLLNPAISTAQSGVYRLDVSTAGVIKTTGVTATSGSTWVSVDGLSFSQL